MVNECMRTCSSLHTSSSTSTRQVDIRYSTEAAEAAVNTVCEFMFISHESGHCQKEKLVVSPAFNQVIQSPLDRLLRVS